MDFYSLDGSMYNPSKHAGSTNERLEEEEVGLQSISPVYTQPDTGPRNSVAL